MKKAELRLALRGSKIAASRYRNSRDELKNILDAVENMTLGQRMKFAVSGELKCLET